MSITVGASTFSTKVAGGTTCACLSASGDVDHQAVACLAQPNNVPNMIHEQGWIVEN